MNLHKDKERLRHQRQVKLLDSIMQIVPKPFNDRRSKVRQLRRLVLYYHFMQKVHAQVTEGHLKRANKKSSKKKLIKTVCKPVMVHCGTKKPPRANIVFLQADRSNAGEKNVLDEPILTDNDNCLKSPQAKKLEYKVSEMVNEVDDNNVFDHNFYLPFGNVTQVHSSHSSSPGEGCIQSDLASETYYLGKENYSPIPTNASVMNSSDLVEEPSMMYDKTNTPENVNDGNLILSKHERTNFQNILKDFSNNSTLRVADNINENLCLRNFNLPEQDSNYILESHPIENMSSYPIDFSSGNFILTSNNLSLNPLHNYDSIMIESDLQSLPSLPENLSDNCSSSTLTDNLHIDVENFSDSSNELSKIKAGSSNDANIDNYDSDSPRTLYNFPHSTLMNYDDYVLPFISPSHNYLEYYNEQNEISFRPVSYLPHFESFARTNVGFVESPPIIQCFEPIHAFQSRLVEPHFIADNNESFYSPNAFENFPSERPPLFNSRSETVVKSEPDSQETFFEENKAGLFDEEVSYPLSNYINNYKFS